MLIQDKEQLWISYPRQLLSSDKIIMLIQDKEQQGLVIPDNNTGLFCPGLI